MNIPMLKGKFTEKGFNVEKVAELIGVDRATLYRKLANDEKFTIKEVRKIKSVLNLTSEEASAIFFG